MNVSRLRSAQDTGTVQTIQDHSIVTAHLDLQVHPRPQDSSNYRMWITVTAKMRNKL